MNSQLCHMRIVNATSEPRLSLARRRNAPHGKSCTSGGYEAIPQRRFTKDLHLVIPQARAA
jgi:hypothetical protein